MVESNSGEVPPPAVCGSLSKALIQALGRTVEGVAAETNNNILKMREAKGSRLSTALKGFSFVVLKKRKRKETLNYPPGIHNGPPDKK
jgi:hypothetical protein